MSELPRGRDTLLLRLMGAGACYDLLGMYPEMKPKFAKRFSEVGEQILQATRAYIGEVQQRTFPGPEHTFKANGPRPAAKPKEEPLLVEAEIPPHWQTH